MKCRLPARRDGCTDKSSGMRGRLTASPSNIPPLSVLPSDEEVQQGAVTLQDAVLHGFDEDRLIPAIRQPVSSGLAPVEPPGLVESPAFGKSQASVPDPLVPGVLPTGAAGCYLHDEVGRFALLGDDIAVAVVVDLRCGIERDEQVGKHPVRRGGTRFPGDVSLAGDYGGFGVAEVLDQVVAAVLGQGVEASHVLWLALRRVRKGEARLGCR